MTSTPIAIIATDTLRRIDVAANADIRAAVRSVITDQFITTILFHGTAVVGYHADSTCTGHSVALAIDTTHIGTANRHRALLASTMPTKPRG